MEKSDDQTLLGTKSESRWLKRILLPFWICRCILLVLMGVAYLTSIYWISQEADIQGGVLAATIVVILLGVLCISLDAVTMILLARDALKPSAFLIIQIVEVVIWTAVIALQVVVAVKTSSKGRSFLTWFVSIILYLAFIGLLVYASIIFYRCRQSASKRGTYAPAHHHSGSEHSLQNRSPSPSNPFDNAYAASLHSRHTSVASLESVFPAPPPYEPSRTNTSQSSNSFVIITPPDVTADVRSAPGNLNRHRYA